MKGIGRVIPPPSDAGGYCIFMDTREPSRRAGFATKSMEGKEQWISLRALGSITSV